jgi:hypothetical protein
MWVDGDSHASVTLPAGKNTGTNLTISTIFVTFRQKYLFYIFLTVHLRIILVGDQHNAHCLL